MHGDVLRMVAVSFAEDIDAAYMNGVFFNSDFKRNIRAGGQVKGVDGNGFCF